MNAYLEIVDLPPAWPATASLGGQLKRSSWATADRCDPLVVSQLNFTWEHCDDVVIVDLEGVRKTRLAGA